MARALGRFRGAFGGFLRKEDGRLPGAPAWAEGRLILPGGRWTPSRWWPDLAGVTVPAGR
jgi:hypothetical protein